MRPRLLLPLLLPLLAVATLVPSLAEGRLVSEQELSLMLHQEMNLTPILQKYKGLIVRTIVCEVFSRSQGKTHYTKVLGIRRTTTAKPTTKATTPVSPPAVTTMPNTMTPNTTASTMAASDEEGSGSGMTMTMEERLNQEESKFDEEQMMRDDNTNNGESNEEGMDSARRKRSLYWSLGYYGIFALSDSHFCYSGYRWSRNICTTSCTAFTDDDITDDVDCFLESGLWRFFLRNASYSCWVKGSHI